MFQKPLHCGKPSLTMVIKAVERYRAVIHYASNRLLNIVTNFLLLNCETKNNGNCLSSPPPNTAVERNNLQVTSTKKINQMTAQINNTSRKNQLTSLQICNSKLPLSLAGGNMQICRFDNVQNADVAADENPHFTHICNLKHNIIDVIK